MRSWSDAKQEEKQHEQKLASTDRIAVFQETAIRRVWHESEWWFSVTDVRAVLTGSPDAGAYWRKLKQRLNAEGSEAVTFCHGLKLEVSTLNRNVPFSAK